jgi:CheY-like chemotaxis protein
MNADKLATILVVDDHPVNVLLLQKLLQAQYRVITADCGAKALAQASSGMPPDLILLDVMMPDMSGYEVCTRLKADPATHDIPVIFVTSMSEMENEEQGLSLGAVDYLTKPISTPILMARVRNHLALRRQAMELEELQSIAGPARCRRRRRGGALRPPAALLLPGGGGHVADRRCRRSAQDAPSRNRRGVPRPARLHIIHRRVRRRRSDARAGLNSMPPWGNS